MLILYIPVQPLLEYHSSQQERYTAHENYMNGEALKETKIQWGKYSVPNINVVWG